MSIHQLTPFIRYGLLILSSHLVTRGYLSDGQASTFASDPVLIEVIAGALMGAGTLAWYLWSTSRKALKAAT